MNDETYIRNLRETLARRASAYDEQLKKENRDYDLISNQSPRDWRNLKDWFNANVTQINTGLSSNLVDIEEIDIDEMQIRCRIGRQFKNTKIEFSRVPGVFARIAAGNLTFDAKVVNGEVRWYLEGKRDATSYTVQDIGRAILTEATSE